MTTKSTTIGRVKALAASLILIAACGTAAIAQNNKPAPSGDEQFGHTLNIGVGPSWGGYYGQSSPFLFFNYEFDVARDFTLAPFIGISSYRSDDRYDGYYYHRTLVPIGIKGTYYFDDLLDLNPDWDIYGGLSLGFVIDNVSWQDGYNGDRDAYHSTSPLFLSLHLGAEYHVSRKVGIFLDLSSDVSTIGVAIHGMHSHTQSHHHHYNNN